MIRPVALLLVSCLLLLPACISSPSTRQTGVRIGDETLAQFKAGVTTEDWLVAVLGKPTSVSEVRGVENTSVLRYATLEQSGGGIASLFSGSSGRETAVTYFIVTDGVVTRFWADRAKEYTALGKPVEVESGSKAPADATKK